MAEVPIIYALGPESRSIGLHAILSLQLCGGTDVRSEGEAQHGEGLSLAVLVQLKLV